jgi:hypothetical protein
VPLLGPWPPRLPHLVVSSPASITTPLRRGFSFGAKARRLFLRDDEAGIMSPGLRRDGLASHTISDPAFKIANAPHQRGGWRRNIFLYHATCQAEGIE